ncbi:unnamed protein product [Amoebophrya sp. A120]|nr:unnamed protein product [Amoebophrya sp. A120]|eukprot:GSA120T00024933001.1
MLHSRRRVGTTARQLLPKGGEKMTWLQLMSGRARSKEHAGFTSRRGGEKKKNARPSETWVDFFANGMGAVALRQVTRGMFNVASGRGSSAKEFLSSREIKAPLRLLTKSLTRSAGGESGGLMAALSTDTGNVNRFLGNDLGLLRPEGTAVFVQVIFRGQHQTAGAPIEGPPLFAELQGPLQTALQGQVGKVFKSDIWNLQKSSPRKLSLPVHFASPVTVKLPPQKTSQKIGKNDRDQHLRQQQFQINLQYLFPLPQAGDLVAFLIPVFSSSTTSASPPPMFSPGAVFAVTQLTYHVADTTDKKAANHDHGGRKQQQQQTFASPEDIFSRGNKNNKKAARISLEAVPLEYFLGLRGPQAYAPRIVLEDLAADTLRLLPPGTAQPVAPGQLQDQNYAHAPKAAEPSQASKASATATSSGSSSRARVGGFRVFTASGSAQTGKKIKQRASKVLRG